MVRYLSNFDNLLKFGKSSLKTIFTEKNKAVNLVVFDWHHGNETSTYTWNDFGLDGVRR